MFNLDMGLRTALKKGTALALLDGKKTKVEIEVVYFNAFRTYI